jgi:hypothetical protein
VPAFFVFRARGQTNPVPDPFRHNQGESLPFPNTALSACAPEAQAFLPVNSCCFFEAGPHGRSPEFRPAVPNQA